jgi:Zn finger protein HypA/HybF involved in hydrogenase expression
MYKMFAEAHMKCMHCGKRVSGEDRICPFCGEEIENVVEGDKIK